MAGLGYSNPTPFHTPGEYSERELAARLEGFKGLRPLVLVCHCPPSQTALDRVRGGLHAGSTAVRDFLLGEQPEYFFCGHIHEAAGGSAEIGKSTMRCPANIAKAQERATTTAVPTNCANPELSPLLRWQRNLLISAQTTLAHLLLTDRIALQCEARFYEQTLMHCRSGRIL